MACWKTANAWSNRAIRQIRVGRVKRLLDAGKSVKEICVLLNLPESHVRSLVKTCEEADVNRAEMNADNNVEE